MKRYLHTQDKRTRIVLSVDVEAFAKDHKMTGVRVKAKEFSD